MSALPAIVTSVMEFARVLRPELTRLFDKHKGDINAARRDMTSLLPEIEKAEADIDAELDRQAAEENPAPKKRTRRSRTTEVPDGTDS